MNESNRGYFSYNCVSERSDSVTITGTEDVDQSLNIYPNPATDYVIVEWSGTEGRSFSLVLSDGLGRDLLKKNMSVNRPGSIDLSGFKAGFYFIRLESEDTMMIKKVVVL